MAAETEGSRSGIDNVLLTLAVLVLAGSIVGFYYFEGQYNILIRVLGMLAGGGVAVAIASQTAMGATVWSYVQGSRVEVRRVVWPNRKETAQTTLVVLIIVLILAMFLYGIDAILLWAVQLLTGRA